MRAFLLAAALVLGGCATAPAPPEEAPGEQAAGVRLNQLGFEPGAVKRAILPSDAASPLPWRLVDSAGAVRAEGVTQVFGADRYSAERVHRIDFSSFQGSGEGFRLVAGGAESRPFPIRSGIYARLPYDALGYFYHNRSGIPIEARFAGGEQWARPAGHAPDRATCISGEDLDGNVWQGCSYTLDASRGWYDAGDHGKYVVNGGIAVWTLMNLYER
ncbi:MAG TPA: glycoside hydrolase family 9 protein, partial [Allosphingosinicella sp.]|nr:glycoside hydrolase family 9 protein [Allosphingosinicella sp.]